VSEPEKFGSYLVYELLGTGGMATVHRAETQSAGGFRKRVALKRLLPHLMDEPEFVDSFMREAKLASYLHHANITQTYDLGMVDGRYFIAMELVPGPTLKQIVRQCADAAGAIPIEHTLDILTQICEALDYAHGLTDDAGKPLDLVHRDVSPANIIVPASGVVKLIDFGLAKVKSSRNTSAGVLKGKLGYMAPEYTLGRLDARADLFAVGVIAHELLTGRRLFESSNDMEIINMLREMPIQPPSRWNDAVARDLDDIVMTALQRNPGNRWQSAKALHAALLNFAREHRLALAHTALGKWTEWAFMQKPRVEESGLARVIDMLGDPSETSIERAMTSSLDTPSPVVEVAPARPEAIVPERTPATVMRPIPAELIAASVPGMPPPSPRSAQPPPKPLTRPPKPPSLDQLALSSPAMPEIPALDQLALSGQFTDGGTDVATHPKIPVAPRRSRWPVLLVMLVVIAGGVAAAWYFGVIRIGWVDEFVAPR
jgi:serine/threonine protein kinase